VHACPYDDGKSWLAEQALERWLLMHMLTGVRHALKIPIKRFEL